MLTMVHPTTFLFLEVLKEICIILNISFFSEKQLVSKGGQHFPVGYLKNIVKILNLYIMIKDLCENKRKRLLQE